jgi:CRISPR/Cas system-associated exonuclease Cas4 (RecB family)
MGETAFEKTTSYFTLFRRYMLTCTTPFEGTPVRGLQVLGVLETRNLSFDRVCVLDVNEEVLPDTRKEDSLLPFKVRQGLGLPTYLDRDQLAAYYFDTLWTGAKEVHLFFIENDQKEKSRFVERLLWEKQRRDRVLDTGSYVSKVQYRVDLKNRVPGEIRKTQEMVTFLREQAFSATGLDTYLKCPRKFYYGRVLGLEKSEEVSGDVERADIGRFVHKVLSRYFGKRKGFQLKRSDIDLGEMDRLVEALFEEDYGRDPLGAIYLLKRQVKARLRDFLKNYTIPLLGEKAVTVLEVEHPVQGRVEGFRVKGILDHIERRDGRICIIDYKTSSNPEGYRIRFDKLDLRKRETWMEAIGSLQLPFYLLLYSEAHGREIEELEALFLLLGKAVINRGIELPLYDVREVKKERFEDLRTVILALLEEILDLNHPFYPSSDPKTSCPICDFQYLCGTQWLTK